MDVNYLSRHGLVKLVFVNIFVSNVTPLATGGGVIQVYLMKQKPDFIPGADDHLGRLPNLP